MSAGDARRSAFDDLTIRPEFSRRIRVRLIDTPKAFIDDGRAMIEREADVVVVGAGIVGCATAYYLARRGVRVVVVERAAVAGEQSRKNWGFVRQQGRDALEVPLAMEANRIWRGLERELGADIEWVQGGNLALAADEARMARFEAWLPVVTQAVARRMIADGGGGSIVNISSTSSRLARPGVAHYGASKAGLNQLTAVAAVELAPHGIRVNAILPGVIGTERVQATAVSSVEARAEHAAKVARIPLARIGEPAEVVSVALFLLSAESSYCTGALFTADGGFTLGIPHYR